MYDAVAGELQRRVWDEAGAQAIGIDPDAATDDELMGAALELERARRALDAVATRVLGELDARGTTDAHDGMRTPQWLAHHAGLPAAAASDRVRYARKARSALRLADESLQAGRIGFQHAKVLSDACNPRIADEFAEEAALLAESAEGITFERWRREVLARADLLDADGGHDPSQDIARNRLTKGATIDETYHLHARLIGSNGELVSQSIDRVADELFRRLESDEALSPTELRLPSRPTLQALALVEICRRAMATDLTSSRAPLTDMTVVINAAEPDAVHTPEGTRLQDGSTRHLLCDPRLRPIVTNRLGVPLDMARDARFATRSQRSAMSVRDGGCVFPGCSSPPSWCDAHHLDEWDADDGTTDVPRMASLCRHHHMVVHRTGWQMTAEPDGTFWFRTPAGRTFWGQQHGRQTRGPTPDTG
jgi:hypothetical protein